MKVTPAELNYNVSGERQYGLGNDHAKYSVNVNTEGLKNDDKVKDILSWNGSDADVNNMPTGGVNNSTVVTDNVGKYTDKLSLNADVLQVKNNNHNYVLKAKASEFTITKAKITVSTVTDSKAYDGNTNSNGIVSYDQNQLYNGDTITGLAQSFETKNAGTGINMKLNSGYVVNDNNNGGNYEVTIVEAMGTINKAKINVEGSRQYDGTNIADGSIFGGNGSVKTGIGDETIMLGGSSVIAGKDVDKYNNQSSSGLTLVNGNNGGLGSNYEIDNVQVAITPKELIISGERQYNGGTDVAGGIFNNISGLVGTEKIAIAGSGNFADKNVSRDGNGNIIDKIFSNGSLALADDLASGGKAGNYVIKGAKAKITPKGLEISGERDYDGSKDANNDIFNTITGIVGTDQVNISTTGKGEFADADVLWENNNIVSKNVTVGTLGLSGADVGNYTITKATAKINPKGLELSGERVYNGGVDANSGIFNNISGLVGTEKIAIAGSGNFADKNVSRDGSGNIIDKAVSNGSLTLVDDLASGGKAGNYIIKDAKAKITPKDLTIKVDTTNERDYGNANPSFNTSGSGFVEGEGFGNLSGSANYKVDGKDANDANANRYLNVGEYDVTVSGYNSGNYNISYASTRLKVNQAKYYYVADPKTYFFGFPIDGSQGGMIVDSSGRVVAADLVAEAQGGHGNFYTLAKQNDPVGSYAILGEGTTTIGNLPVWLTNNYSIEQTAGNSTALRILPNDQYQTEIANNAHSGNGGMIQRLGVGSIRFLSLVESGVKITDMKKTSNIKVDEAGNFIVEKSSEKSEE